jgi:VWFA-related protein
MTPRFKASALGLSVAAMSLWGALDSRGHAGQAGNQGQQMPVYRAGVDLVVLNVAVLDDDGDPVTGLSAEDFTILEDGVPQEVALFASSSNTPLDIALVLDMSGSVAASAPSIKRDAKAFLDALGPSDCVYFVPFQEKVHAGTWSAPDAPALISLVNRIPLRGGTALYDALARGLTNVNRARYPVLPSDQELDDYLQVDGDNCGTPLPPEALGVPGSVRRTAVVLLSDGGDEHSEATYADTLTNAWSNTVPIFSIAVGDALAPMMRSFQENRGLSSTGVRSSRLLRWRRTYSEELQKKLRFLTRMTGGRLVLGKGPATVRDAFDEVVKMLRSSYLVGYNQPLGNVSGGISGLSWHRVDVEIKDQDASLFVRPGYYRDVFDRTSAEKIVRESLELTAAGHHAEAVKQFDLATQLDPGYWPTYLHRARSLLQVGQLEDARDDLLAAVYLRPELGLAHELLADTAFKLGDFKLAWYHIIRAAQDGVDMAPLAQQLMDVSEGPPDLAEQLSAVRIFVDVGPPSVEIDQATLLELLRVLRTEMSVASDISLVSNSANATAALILEAQVVRGRPRKLEGKLVIRGGPSDAVREERLQVDDLDDPVEIASGISKAAREMRMWVQKTYGQ